MPRVVHFEIHGTEPERLVEFYTSVFGWTFEKWGDTPYWVITTGPNTPGPEGIGINGGLTQRIGEVPSLDGPVSAYVCIVGVADAQATFDKALAEGGSEALPVTHMPGVGLVGYLRDPDRNLVGIIQPDPDSMPAQEGVR